MPARKYSSTAVATALAAGVSGSATTIFVSSVSGFPTSFPYTLILDEAQPSEELVEVTAASGTSLTVTRGIDSTLAANHDAGAIVRHGFSARDLAEPQNHIYATSGVHGLAAGDAVVGRTATQTLEGKTLDGSKNTFTAIPAAAVTGAADSIALTSGASSTGAPSSLVKTDAAGRVTVLAPTADGHPTPKSYVTNLLAGAAPVTKTGTDLDSGWTGNVVFARYGSLVQVTLRITRTSGTSVGEYNVVTIPAGLEPVFYASGAVRPAIAGVLDGGYGRHALVQLKQTAGVFKLSAEGILGYDTIATFTYAIAS